MTGRGRTCDASRFRRALYRLSYGHASSGTSRASPSISPLGGRSTQQAGAFPAGHGRVLCLVRPKPERCCPCHSPTLRPWIAVRPLRTSGAVDVLRGGALEPDPRTPAGNWQAKAHAYCLRLFPAHSAEIFLSQAGPQLELECFTLSITLGSDVGLIAFGTKKATRLGSPSSGSVCR